MPTLIEIHEPDDPRVAPYRDVRERDLVGRDGLFVAEGETVLRILLGSQRFHRPASLLVAEGRLPRLAPLLATLPEEVPVYTASVPVMSGIAGFHIHRGVLALGRRSPEPPLGALLGAGPGPACVVVLIGLSNHDNVGGVFRNAAAFGADAVLLDRTCCDPLYRKAIRVSAGASLIVPFARAAAPDLLDALEQHGFEILALTPRGGEPLSTLARPARVAVVLGAEGPGLPQPVLSRLRTVSIPMAAGFDSLNVATASGIALHHLRGT